MGLPLPRAYDPTANAVGYHLTPLPRLLQSLSADVLYEGQVEEERAEMFETQQCSLLGLAQSAGTRPSRGNSTRTGTQPGNRPACTRILREMQDARVIDTESLHAASLVPSVFHA
jgi:hypothetical protein